jgi:hypothetical protein
MITYKKTTDVPRLVIQYDSDAQSPREWSNLGYFLTKGNSPDGKDSAIYSIMIETGDEATSPADHIKRMTARINAETGEKIKAIFPVVKYEHGDVSYSIGEKHGFDYSNNGFYIITDKTLKEMPEKKKEWARIVKNELETYTKWANGYVYGFTLCDKDGNFEDSCWDIYDIEDIREALPDEFKNEDLTQYLKS